MKQPAILDTCTLLYLFLDQTKLSKKALLAIEHSAQILSISFAEIACKVKLGKLGLGQHQPIDLYRRIQMVKGISVIDINTEMWLDAVALDWKHHKDPADRLIVSYAKKRKLSIITSDAKMKQFYHRCFL